MLRAATRSTAFAPLAACFPLGWKRVGSTSQDAHGRKCFTSSVLRCDVGGGVLISKDSNAQGGFTASLASAGAGAAAGRERFRNANAESAESKDAGFKAYSGAKLFKKERYHIEKSRKVVVVVGLTGSGKSSTGNTIAGARRAFETGGSVASVTRSVAVRDYSFSEQKWRIIDTPGFADTSVGDEQILGEVRELFKYAKYGIACVVVVVKKARFTAEQEEIVRHILDLFGGEQVLPYGMLVVTNTTEPQEKLLDDISKLPMDHSLRRLSALMNDRVLPVENIKEPNKTTCRMLLHHAFNEILEENEGGLYKIESILSHWKEDATLKYSIQKGLSRKTAMKGRGDPVPTDDLPDGVHCESSWDPVSRRLTTVCQFPPIE